VLLVVLASLLPKWIVGWRIHRGRKSGSQFKDFKDRLAAENDMRTGAYQALTALVLIVGAGATLLQIFDNEDTTRQQIKLTTRSQDGQQFTQAVSELASRGSNNQPARLGGVYSLTQLATNSPTDYQTRVVDVLSTYLQQGIPRLLPTQSPPSGPLVSREPSLQAAITALGGDLANKTDGHLLKLSLDIPDGQSLYFGGARFDGFFAGADLKLDGLDDADFRGADLRRACLLGSSVENADFRGADLRGADFRNVENIRKARFDRRTRWNSDTRFPGVPVPGLGPKSETPTGIQSPRWQCSP